MLSSRSVQKACLNSEVTSSSGFEESTISIDRCVRRLNLPIALET